MTTHPLGRASTRPLLLTGGVLALCVAGLVLGYWIETPVLLQIAYPVAALLVATLLYASTPAHYLGFAWWMWFVTPFVRRLLDYQAMSFSAASPVMLTPYLVTGLCLITLFRFGGQLMQRRYVPVLLVLLGLGYGYLVGVVKAGVWAATFDLLEWVTPVLLGFHVLVLWRLYPAHRRVVRAAFGWGVVVLGTYGVIQFFAPAAWDTHWMVASGMTSSIGQPEAYQLRVFSMLNSPGPFAMVMMAGLLVLLDGRGPLARLAVVPGYAAFLLSLVRGAWGGWLLGLLYAVRGVRGTGRRRLLALLVLSALTLLPLMAYAPAVERITHRFDSFAALEEDNSFNARLRLYANVSGRVLANPVGRGLGSSGRAAKLGGGRVVSLDSGLLAVPLALGWPGTILYVGGLVLLLRRLRRRGATRRAPDPFVEIAGGIVMAYLALLVFANQLTGVKGAVLWTFLGLALAAGIHRRAADRRRADQTRSDAEPVLKVSGGQPA